MSDPPAWILWNYERGDWNRAKGQDAELEQLQAELLSWAKRWNLIDPWLLDWALRFLWNWHEQGEMGEDLSEFIAPYFSDGAIVEPFTFQFRGWVPQWEPLATYREALKAQFEEEVRAYLWVLSNEAEDRGYQKSPALRAGGAGAKVKAAKDAEERATRRSTDPHRPIEWLVWYQVGRRSREDIAEEYGVGEGAVKKALARQASLIDLTLRPE